MTERKPNPPLPPQDSPEITERDMARARPADHVLPPAVAAALVRKQGRPKIDPAARKQPVSIRLSPDVLAALRASGDGWQTRVDDLLRAALSAPGRLLGAMAPETPIERLLVAVARLTISEAEAERRRLAGEKLFGSAVDAATILETPDPANNDERRRGGTHKKTR